MLSQTHEITPKAQGFSKPSFVQESMEFLLNKSLIQKLAQVHPPPTR